MTDKDTGGLTAEESAYFEAQGEAALPEPEITPAPEKQPDEPAPQEPEKAGERDDRGRFVPHGALHAEREEHKKTRSELDELKRFRAVMEDRWRMVEQAGSQQQQREVQNAIPDETAEPIETIAWLKQQVLQRQQAEVHQQQEWQQRQQAEHQFREVFTQVDQTFRQREQQDPDVTEAFNYARESYAREMRALGTPEREIETRLGNFVNGFVTTIHRNGFDPGDFAKQIASARGWQPKPKTQEDVKLPDQLRRIGDAQQASRTVGQGNGRAGGEELGLAEIVAMPSGEFQKWHSDPKNAARFDRLMGA